MASLPEIGPKWSIDMEITAFRLGQKLDCEDKLIDKFNLSWARRADVEIFFAIPRMTPEIAPDDARTFGIGEQCSESLPVREGLGDDAAASAVLD